MDIIIKKAKPWKRSRHGFPKDMDNVHDIFKKGTYTHLGFVGLKKGTNEFQIYINPRYRGKDIARKAEDQLAKKFKLSKVVAIVKKKNIPSLKMHRRSGFKKDPLAIIHRLRGKLSPEDIRLIKRYRD